MALDWVRAAPAYREETIRFQAGDGMMCNLVHVCGQRDPWRGPVLLVHGAGVRANLFRAPTRENLVDALLAAGYDVWLENWRASIDLAPNEWTLDQAAVYDHPYAVNAVQRLTGASKVKAVVHCQGSTSFVMSLASGLLPQVSTVVSNAVSLFPVIPRFARVKLNCTLPLLRPMMRYLNPAWGLDAPTWQAKLICQFVLLTHHECDNAVCKLVSFTYGAGFPALWEHCNLNPETHEWLKHEFAAVPLTFFHQIRLCVQAGRLRPVAGTKELSQDLGIAQPRTHARIAFLAGEKNKCFLAESQVLAYRFFESFRPANYSLHLFPEYSHLDVFLGQDASRDIFPTILAELEKEPLP